MKHAIRARSSFQLFGLIQLIAAHDNGSEPGMRQISKPGLGQRGYALNENLQGLDRGLQAVAFIPSVRINPLEPTVAPNLGGRSEGQQGAHLIGGPRTDHDQASPAGAEFCEAVFHFRIRQGVRSVRLWRQDDSAAVHQQHAFPAGCDAIEQPVSIFRLSTRPAQRLLPENPTDEPSALQFHMKYGVRGTPRA